MNTKQALRTIAQTTDEALAPLLQKAAELEARGAQMGREIASLEINDRSPRYVAARREAMVKVAAELEDVKAEAAPLRKIEEAGRWTRFIYVPGGHVHRWTGCSTLYMTTQTFWLTEFSGADEAELVEAAADAACTVCFPSAPVDRPSTIGVYVKAREEREAEAAEKAAKKAAANAAKITVGRKVYKTQRAAENEIGWQIENVVSRRYMEAFDADHREHLNNLSAEDLEAARVIAEAIAEQVEGYDVEAILTKKFDAKVKMYRKAGWDIPADASL